MPTSRRKACEGCAFFVAAQGNKTEGGCRRLPPVMVTVQGGFQTNFPIVRADWWCGEFTTKTKP